MTEPAREDVEALRRRFASQFNVPDGGQYRNDWAERIDAVLTELERVTQERDDYRFWNERVRTCEQHTGDIAAPVGDCLICTIEELQAEVERLRAAMRRNGFSDEAIARAALRQEAGE